MKKDSRVYVAGHRGLVGSSIIRQLRTNGYENIITRTHAELDLTNQEEVKVFFQKEKPEFVFLCAAKVGGILSNLKYPAEFIQQNLAIQTNVIHESWRTGVNRLLFLGSSCIYPRDCPQPIHEKYLLTGQLEWTNRPYAVAKISGIEMCWSYNRQYNTKYLAIMPTNLFGPGDNYDLDTSHVLPALIRKMHEAKVGRKSSVLVWGSGKPRREFLYSDDLGDAAMFLMDLPEGKFNSLLGANSTINDNSLPPLVNIGAGKDITILELAELVKRIIGFEGDLEWDNSKPDGTPRKLLDVSRMEMIGWKAKTVFNDGIAKAYDDYLKTLNPKT